MRFAHSDRAYQLFPPNNLNAQIHPRSTLIILALSRLISDWDGLITRMPRQSSTWLKALQFKANCQLLNPFGMSPICKCLKGVIAGSFTVTNGAQTWCFWIFGRTWPSWQDMRGFSWCWWVNPHFIACVTLQLREDPLQIKPAEKLNWTNLKAYRFKTLCWIILISAFGSKACTRA